MRYEPWWARGAHPTFNARSVLSPNKVNAMDEFFPEIQHFGATNIDGEEYDFMICLDRGRPDEVMIHYWTAKNAEAVLCIAKRQSPDGILLKPRQWFRPNQIGGLEPINLSVEQAERLTGYSASLTRSGKTLSGSWFRQSDNSSGELNIHPPRNARVAATPCRSWDGFKAWANERRQNGSIYRGQGSNRFRLSSALHRTGRARLERFTTEIVPNFHRHAEAALRERIDLRDPMDMATLLGLAQHHGLPTPLMDWTESPYIAAFFALADAVENRSIRLDVTCARVYCLAKTFLQKWHTPRVTIDFVMPYVAPFSISSYLNDRIYAQRGMFLVSNIADIESYVLGIQQHSKPNGVVELEAIDIPIAFADEALDELAFIGVTHASLFPGLEGVCRTLAREIRRS
jgi:hypothetical protein